MSFPIPRTTSPDSTLALALDPYRFVSTTCAQLGTDVFQTRLLLRQVICLTGRDAAELVCDPARFVRSGAAPVRVQKTLFGQGGVQGLDGDAHRHRKALFTRALMTPDRIGSLSAAVAERLRVRARAWAGDGRVSLFPEACEVLTRSVCAWAGVPLAEAEVARRTAELTALFNSAAAVGPPHWRSRRARRHAERWCGDLVEQVRAGRLQPANDTALFAIAWHRELDGSLLDAHTAAVELLNVLRPTVAVAVYVVFVALALHKHPEWHERLAGQDDAFREAFVQEVRRTYPFFPAVAARTRCNFEWKGYRFPADVRVMLDLYGTDHDPRLWEEPEAFRPERFLGRQAGAFALIPQGPGEAQAHHRCPGEAITVALMKVAARFLSAEVAYRVAPQELGLRWRRMPPLPRSGFVIDNVRAAGG